MHHGTTAWHGQGKLLGRRDVDLNEEGAAQAQRLADALADFGIAEVVSSPLTQALQTAEVLGKRCGIELARDNRLIDFNLGRWEGQGEDDIVGTSEFQQFLANPVATSMPDGESFQEVKRRAVAAVEQTLEDNPSGAAIAVVTHSRVIRVLLSHYLAAPPATYHRLQIFPASVSVLSFSHDSHLPRVLAVNWIGDLGELLGHVEQSV